MTTMTGEGDSTGEPDESGAPQTPAPPATVDPRAMSVIQTGATQFTQGLVQGLGTVQSMDQIITSYSSSSSGSYYSSSSSGSYSTTFSTSLDKMDVDSGTENEKDKESADEEAEPKFKCAVCQDDFEITEIIFSCFGCTDGKVCGGCTGQVIRSWKAQALQDTGRTIDTNLQIFFVYSAHVLGCPICRRPFSPGLYDSTLRWYKSPSFPPPAPGRYTTVSDDYSTADLDVNAIRNGFGQARYFTDYATYLTGKPQLTGDCPQCGDGNGRYVTIPARNAATRGRQPWGNGAPWCLTCPSAQPFGADDDLLFCSRCHQSVLHPRHATGTGSVQTGTFYTETFSQ